MWSKPKLKEDEQSQFQQSVCSNWIQQHNNINMY